MRVSARAAASLAVGGLVGALALGELTRAHLLTEIGRDRYRCHDLLRTYATGLARATGGDANRDAATSRLKLA